MFWSQIDENSINDLFTKDVITLEEVLDHESLLQECKIQNEKLVHFICLNNNFCNLLDYILKTPGEDIEEKVRFKYPSLICEVLTSDIPEIDELLVHGIKLSECPDSNNSGTGTLFINRLLDKLENEVYINPLTMSFLVKICLHILKHNNDAVMNYLIQKRNSLNSFLKHVENNAIIVFFTEFLMCEDEYTFLRIQWMNNEDFVYKCAQMFGVGEYRNNSVQELLCEIIGASWRYFSNKEMREEIRNQLNGQAFLDLIFAHLTNPKSDSNLITGCIKVIRTIIDFETGLAEQKISNIKEMLMKHFYSLILLLSSPPKQLYDPMPTTIGRITPFGPTRLEIVYLLESLLKLKDTDINTKIGQTNIFSVLMTFVSQYKWNTLFQLGMMRIFDTLFGDLSDNSSYRSLLNHLVSDYDIYHWFMEIISETSQVQIPKPGTMGLLWKIGNHLNSLWCSKLFDDLSNKEQSDSDEWSKIVDQYLAPRNKENTISAPKIDSGFRDMDINVIDIDEDSASAYTNPDIISAMFKDKSPMLDEIFGAASIEDCDDWIDNELRKTQCKSSVLNDDDDDDEEDSSSDDEVAPAVIRQRSDGNAAKYLLSDVPNNGDMFELPAMTSVATAVSSIKFEDFWKIKSSPDTDVVDDWAQFHM